MATAEVQVTKYEIAMENGLLEEAKQKEIKMKICANSIDFNGEGMNKRMDEMLTNVLQQKHQQLEHERYCVAITEMYQLLLRTYGEYEITQHQ